MKKLLFILSTLLLIMGCKQTAKANAETTQSDNAEKAKKVLVLYYSQTGATKSVAEEIQKQMNADIEEIFAVNPYNGDFNATIARCQEEMAKNELPKIHSIKSVIEDYDIVFLGYPIWFGKAAPPALTFVEQYDLSKVKVIPFCTFGSGGKTSGVKSLQDGSDSEIDFGPCYGVRNARVASAPAEIKQFLCENGLLEGEYEKKGDYSEQQPVTAAETEIFNKACGSYPMLHATPTTVGKRTVKAGTEYLFNAEDAGMDGKKANIKIYVTVGSDANAVPEFTEVDR